jgi:DNA-binding response OmpR family regulator
LVLLDLLMPYMNGLQVLEALRACEQRDAGRVPIFMITSDPTIGSRHAALGHGATDFLNKPFDSVEIVLRASNLLETRFLIASSWSKITSSRRNFANGSSRRRWLVSPCEKTAASPSRSRARPLRSA